MTANIIYFLLLITILVFVHEFGHYYVARICGIHAEIFSVGFGPKLAEITDKLGTKWRISALPLGGYVKFIGDEDPSSSTSNLSTLSEKQQQYALDNKPLYKRYLVVLAGPAFNFLYAILIIAYLLNSNGKLVGMPIVSEVLENSPAEESGIKAGDEIIELNGKKIRYFAEVQSYISRNPNREIELVIMRGDELMDLTVIPKAVYIEDFPTEIGQIGIKAGEFVKQDYNIVQAVIGGIAETYNIAKFSLVALYEILIGDRNTKELSGVIGIAQHAGKSAEKGPMEFIWLSIILSINLGVINLLPIPVLDGGHILKYTIEALVSKKASEKFYEVGVKFGIAVIISLTIFSIINDISKL